MAKKDINQKGTDRDVRPQQGQQSNENWDDQNSERSSGTTSGRGSDARRIDEETNTTGVGSSQRNREITSDLFNPTWNNYPVKNGRIVGGTLRGRV